MNKYLKNAMLIGTVALAGAGTSIALTQTVKRMDAPKQPTRTAATRSLNQRADVSRGMSASELAAYQQNSQTGGGN